MRILNEVRRSELVVKSKSSDREKDGKTRFQKRVKSRVLSNVKNLNQIDMNKLFYDDVLTVFIDVQGETDKYAVSITFGGFLNQVHRELRSGKEFDLRVAIKSLVAAFNSDNVYVRCSCLHPDTKIKLLDGSSPTVEEMLHRYESGEQLYVYSVNEDGDFVPGTVESVWVSGSSIEFIKITLDNDREIVTTPEHLYMLRDGSYCEAEKLSVGQSLMPLYFGNTNGYETIRYNSKRGCQSTYKMVAEYFKSDDINLAMQRVTENDSKFTYRVAIHHSDFNKSNNNPENLKIMTAYEHWKYHADLCGENRVITEHMREVARANAKKRNANPTERMLEQRRKFNKAGVIRNYDADRKLQQSELMRHTIKDYYENLSEEDRQKMSDTRSKISKNSWENGCFDTEVFREASKKRGEFLHTDKMQKLAVEGQHKYWQNLSEADRERRAQINRDNLRVAHEKCKGSKFTDEHKQRISDAKKRMSPERKAEHAKKINLKKIETILRNMLHDGVDMTLELYETYRKSYPNGYPRITKYFESMSSAIAYFQLNHKVKSIERIILNETPVYNISVKEQPNFLTDAGVILHNCPDFKYRMAYWDTKNDSITGAQELRPSDITNPNDTKGPGCKHIMLVLANHSWLIKVASVIVNYVNWMKVNREMLYADAIYPALYGKKYTGEEPVQMSIDDTSELETDTDTLDRANQAARAKGQFKQGNEFRFTKGYNRDKNQIGIEDEQEG